METQITTNEHAPAQDSAALEKIFSILPLATYRAGETVLVQGSTSNRLLILKKGVVVILKDSFEIATVKEAGAVLGEVSVLLDQPHTADVRALEDSQFYVADPALLSREPITVLHVAKILAQRLIAADEELVELKKHLQLGQSPSFRKKIIERLEKALYAGSTDAPQLTPQEGASDRFNPDRPG